MEKYDLCVIGSGPSGYAAAMRAIDFGKRVLLVEKNQLGGAGIHHGALSSKTWWELSRDAQHIRKYSQKLNFEEPNISFNRVIEEVTAATIERMGLLQDHMHNLNMTLGKDLFFYKGGTAKVIGKHKIEISTSTGKEVVKAENIVLATGSRPRKLHFPVDEQIIMTSDGIANMTSFPESIVILGAGVIGCEFATIFSNFGKTKVYLIDKGDRILPFEDLDVVKVIERNLEKRGCIIHRNSSLESMEIEDGRVKYVLNLTDGSQKICFVEKALISIGRIPNYENLFDEKVGIEIDNRGIIDKDTQTSVPNIYAVGDITADMALVNIGELEGRYAVERMFGKPKKKLIYENIATIMFLHPEVAGVGINETKAQLQGIEYKVVNLKYQGISRAIAMRNTEGFMKILVTNDDKMKVLGMRVVGEHASSALEAIALLVSINGGIEELAELVHPHPSIIEGIQECVRVLLGKSILKPQAMKGLITYRSYKGGKYEDIVTY